MADAGFLMLLTALKRNHVSGADTERDIDNILTAARDALKAVQSSGILG